MKTKIEVFEDLDVIYLKLFYIYSWLFSSAWTSYSKLENSTSFNPQNSNSAKPELKNTWKTHITRAKTRNTWAKVEIDTYFNLKVWNSMKLDIKWACSSTWIVWFDYHSRNSFCDPAVNVSETGYWQSIWIQKSMNCNAYSIMTFWVITLKREFHYLTIILLFKDHKMIKIALWGHYIPLNVPLLQGK